MKKIKSFYIRISNFVKRYGIKEAIKKTFQKIFPGGKPSERKKNIKKDTGFIPGSLNNIDSELSRRYPGMKPLQLVTTAMRKPTINLVIDCITEENQSGDAAVPLIFSTLMSKRIDMPLRIISRTKRPQKRYFGAALKKAGLTYDKDVEFIFSDPMIVEELFLINNNDLFITTSWWTTKSIMDSFAKEKMIYLILENEEKLSSPGKEVEICLEVMKDEEINIVIKSEQLFDQLMSEGFENIRNNANWFDFPTNDWEKSFVKIYSWLEKRDSIKCIK